MRIDFTVTLPIALCAVLLCFGFCGAQFHSIELHAAIQRVQPMTGIVVWTSSGQNGTDAIQLEYSYAHYNQIVKQKNVYDWTPVEQLLGAVAARGHQAILRFYYVYPGDATTVPEYIKSIPGYAETKGMSEGKETWFPDWSHPELQRFHLDFYTRFAEKFDNDPRLAFLQTGFGLWAEYHIYDGPCILGKTFPGKEFQETNVKNMESCFKTTPWSISIDAADPDRTPFSEKPELKNVKFGLFDDSFMCEKHDTYNADCWKFFGAGRYKISPCGGEFSYYTDYDQKHVLDPQGIYGRPFETLAGQFHISYMIGNDQPDYQAMSRIKEAGMACGYKYEIISFKASMDSSVVQVKNKGIAPIYHDAFVSIDGVRAKESLKELQPGETKTYGVAKGGISPVLSIACDRLVSGQKIEFAANLPGTSVKKADGTNKGCFVPPGGDVLVFSAQGRLVAKHTGGAGGTLVVRGIPGGLYIVAVRRGGGATVRIGKLVIQGRNVTHNKPWKGADTFPDDGVL